ncbi:MAG: rod shape-determining protein MreC [Tannerella sp.]|jgi:rod shape-determining protein MreC|nr:rod shape-determining protein MreC [Tannerella sp.]
MRKLFEFLIAKRHWLLFFLCETIAFTLIYRNNAYQRNMIMTSANVVSGRILSVSNAVFSYLDLAKMNRQLYEKNNRLEMELIMLRKQLSEEMADTLDFSGIFLHDVVAVDTTMTTGGGTHGVVQIQKSIKNIDYEYITAEVVNNSIVYTNNYITINKGANDGIQSDMGVVSMNGLVGVVMTVKANYSLVISLLNTNLKVSAKVKNTNYFGSLSWKGGNPRFAFLEELPTHSVFNVGDTIVTSGYSTIFPQGMMIGTVEAYDKQHDDNFFSLKVLLATDFQALRTVSAILNRNQEEQKEVEKGAKKND